jgi:hypothetical protein
MFKFIIRLTSNFKLAPYDQRISISRDNNHLMEIYNEQNLTQEQKVLMLGSVFRNLGTVNQMNAIFNTAIGQRFLKDAVSMFKLFKPVQQSWVISILASTTGKNRKFILDVNKQNELVLEICDKIDPVESPKECLRAYKDIAILNKVNSNIEKKVSIILESVKNLDLNDYIHALQGALHTSRDISFSVCKKVENNLKNYNFMIEDVDKLVQIWKHFIEIRMRYGIGENLLKNLSDTIINKKNDLTVESIYNITNSYVKDNFLPRELLLTGLERIVDKREELDFFWGDRLEKIIINLGTLSLNGFQFNLKEEFYQFLMELIWKLNTVYKIKDSESVFLMSILANFTLNFPATVTNYFLFKYQNGNKHIRICISALLSRLNMMEMQNDLVKNCKSNIIVSDFSYMTMIDIYYIIKATGLENEYVEIKDFLQGLERRFGDMIIDVGSYYDYSSILLKHEEFYRGTRVWDKMTESSLKVFENLLKTKDRSVSFLLQSTIKLYNCSSPVHDEWLRVVKLIINRSQPMDIENSIYNNFDHKELGGIIEVLENYEQNCNFAFAHCLTFGIRQPSFNILSKITDLFSRYDKKIFNEKRMRITKYSLFSQIFKKGFSPKIQNFLKEINYSFIINKTNIVSMFKFINLSAQYGHLNESQGISISNVFMKELKNDPNMFMAVATVVPSLLEESNQIINEFMKFDSNDLDELLGKINLFLKISKPFDGEEEFLNRIQEAIVESFYRDPLCIIELLQGISPKYHKTKLNQYKQLLNFLIEILIEKNLEWFSVNHLGHALIAIINKGYNNEEHISALEKWIGNSLKSDDLIEAIIRLYLEKKRFNQFLDLNFSIAINFLKDSTFFELTQLKNTSNKSSKN